MSTDDSERLVRMETKLDILVEAKHDHETRLRTVEKRSWLVAGATAVIAVFAPSLVKL